MQELDPTTLAGRFQLRTFRPCLNMAASDIARRPDARILAARAQEAPPCSALIGRGARAAAGSGSAPPLGRWRAVAAVTRGWRRARAGGAEGERGRAGGASSRESAWSGSRPVPALGAAFPAAVLGGAWWRGGGTGRAV